MSDEPRVPPARSEPSLDVLIASKDRNFVTLARAVLRAPGHHVVTTTVRSERVRRQVRLREPRVLLLDADPITAAALLADPGAPGTVVVRVTDEPDHAATDAPPAVDKWGPASDLLSAVEDAGQLGDPQRPRRARLRLVRQ